MATSQESVAVSETVVPQGKIPMRARKRSFLDDEEDREEDIREPDSVKLNRHQDARVDSSGEESKIFRLSKRRHVRWRFRGNRFLMQLSITDGV